MKRVTLEIVRDGEATGRLLSPTTSYVGLCENHPPKTFHLEFDHMDLLQWQRDLRYGRVSKREAFEFAAGTRRADDFTTETEGLDRASAAMARVFDSIPPLATELGPHTDPGTNDPEGPRAHLRIIMAPLELASLPFECARAPGSFRGAGLFLTRDLGVAVTREIHRVPTQYHRWRDRPRILLASTDADPNVPLAANVVAIMKALRSHLGWHEDAAKEACEYLQVRPQITLEELASELAAARGRDRAYTHIHLLGHGVVRRDEFGRPSIGVQFFRKDGTPRFVTGEELATALRPCGGAPPSTLTLAVCDGGGTQDVLAPTGSIAHHLHANGFPLVIASQFPLTFEGSVVMSEVFYTEVLRGKDPRHALYCTRRALHTRVPRSHDWAGLLAYASFSDDIERQNVLARQRVRQTLADVSLERAARPTRQGSTDEAQLDDLDRRFAEFVDAMKSTSLPYNDRAHAARHVASMSLRWLDVLSQRAASQQYGLPRSAHVQEPPKETSASAGALPGPARPADDAVEGRSQLVPLSKMKGAAVLRQADEAYAVYFRYKPIYWAFVQRLVVKVYMGKVPTGDELITARSLVRNARERAESWQDEDDTTREEELARVEGHEATLVALALASGVPVVDVMSGLRVVDPVERCVEHVCSVVRRVGATSFQAFGARRDAVRFRDHGSPAVKALGSRLIGVLDDLDVPHEWKSRAS